MLRSGVANAKRVFGVGLPHHASQSPEEKAKEKQKKRDTHGRSVGDVAVAACSPYTWKTSAG